MNCHNGEKFLNKSIKSVLAQTYRNWELIFFDNVSSDNSKKIIKSFKDKRIKIFSSPRYIKLYEARNLALKKTKGKYVAFLDTDDWWKKNKLKKQVSLLIKNEKVKFVYSNYYFFDDNNKRKRLINNNLKSGFITKFLLKDYSIGILTVILEKKLLQSYKFKNNYNIIGDFDLFTRLSLKYPFYKVDEPLAYYRSHSNNFFKTHNYEFFKEMKNWIKKNKKLFKKNNIMLFYPWLMVIKLQIKHLFKFD